MWTAGAAGCLLQCHSHLPSIAGYVSHFKAQLFITHLLLQKYLITRNIEGIHFSYQRLPNEGMHTLRSLFGGVAGGFGPAK